MTRALADLTLPPLPPQKQWEMDGRVFCKHRAQFPNKRIINGALPGAGLSCSTADAPGFSPVTDGHSEPGP